MANNFEAQRARIAAMRLRVEIAKGWDDSKHPRYPKGDPQGGEFAPSGGSVGSWLANWLGYHNQGNVHDLADPNYPHTSMKPPPGPSHTIERKGSVLHPALDNEGRQAFIHRPNTPTDPKHWANPDQPVTITPGCPTPKGLNGVPFKAVPEPEDWHTVAGQNPQIEEGLPPLENIKGMHAAAGIIMQEPDGRIWLCKPLNQYGGYRATYPKGSVEPGLTLQQTAIKEAWEETGLQVKLVGVLGDFKRQTSVARYYIAERTGGDPAKMGWESQALKLVPLDQADSYLNMPVDREILKAYRGESTLTSKAREPFIDRSALASLQKRLDKLAGSVGISKEYDEGSHPRWPKGSPLGGQWMSIDEVGITKPPTIGSKANPSFQNKANAAYEAAKAGDKAQLHKILGDLTGKADKYGYTHGAHPSEAYATAPHSQGKWAQQAHQYVQHLADQEKGASFATLTSKAPDVGGSVPVSLTTYKKVGGKLGGTSAGGQYQAPDGTKYYVKGVSGTGEVGADRAKNEVLASKLLQAAGAGTVEMHLVTDLPAELGGKPGAIGVASKMVNGVPLTAQSGATAIKNAQADFAAHAWLANYDSIGQGFDNSLVLPGNKVVNVDPGGGLLYRAQGTIKYPQLPYGQMPADVPEWNSMRDKGKNAQTSAIYGSMTSSDLANSAEKLKAVDDQTISDLVAQYGPGTPEQKLALANSLIQRRDDILYKKAGLPKGDGKPGVAEPEPKPAPTVSGGTPETGGYTAPTHKEWMNIFTATNTEAQKISGYAQVPIGTWASYAENKLKATPGTPEWDQEYAQLNIHQNGGTASKLAGAKIKEEMDKKAAAYSGSSAPKVAFSTTAAVDAINQGKSPVATAYSQAHGQTASIYTDTPASKKASLANLKKLGDAAEKAQWNLSPDQTWSKEALQAKLAIDHGIEHGDLSSVAQASAVLDDPKWANATGNGSPVGDAYDALNAYAHAADAHIQQYGGSNYQTANEARHEAAAGKFGPGNPPKATDFWIGGKGSSTSTGPLTHQTATDAGHMTQVADLTQLHASGDLEGLKAKADYFNTAVKTGTYESFGRTKKYSEAGLLNQKIKADYANALVADLQGGSLAADASKPITGGATWKALTADEWKAKFEAVNTAAGKVHGAGGLNVENWTKYAQTMTSATPGTDDWESKKNEVHDSLMNSSSDTVTNGSKAIYREMQAKEAALGGVAPDAPEKPKPDAFAVKETYGPDNVPGVSAFMEAGVKTPGDWAKSAQTYKQWHEWAKQGADTNYLQQLKNTLDMAYSPSAGGGDAIMHGYVTNLINDIEGGGASATPSLKLAPTPAIPNFQHTTKTAVAYYEGVVQKMNAAYQSGDMKALTAAATKPSGKLVWPTYESGSKVGLPKTMNGQLLADYHHALINQLSDAQKAVAEAELAKPVGPIPAAGNNIGSKPAMPDFNRQMIKTENTNAASHNAKVFQIKTLAEKGDVKGLLALNYGTNTYGKKQAKLANDALAALGSEYKVTPGQKKNSHFALTMTGSEQPVTHAATGKPLSAALTDKELPPKIDFANYKGAGQGLSSKAAVNAANQAEYDKLIAMAKAGDMKGIKNATFQPIDPATGNPVGNPTSISQHPSQHIKNLQSLLLQTMDEKLHPPEPLKFYTGKAYKTIAEVHAAVPAAKFGTIVDKHHSNQAVGYFLALGQVENPDHLKPAKTFDTPPSILSAAHGDYAKMSPDAKKFVTAMTGTGGSQFANPNKPATYYLSSSSGPEAAAEWKQVATAAHEYARELPEGTTIYKWDDLSPDTKQKLALAQPGLILQNPAPVCASYSPTATKNFGSSHRFKIIMAKGAKVVSTFSKGSHASEGEWSLLPNYRIMILGYDKHGAPGGVPETTVLLLPPDPALDKPTKLKTTF